MAKQADRILSHVLRVFSKYFLGLGVGLSLLSVLYGIVNYQAYYGDGAFFVFQNLMFKQIFYDGTYWRQSDIIFQLPALSLSLVSTKLFYDWAPSVFNFTYLVHPILSLIYCYWIVKRLRRPWLMLFPLASFGSATLCTLGFAVSSVPDALSFFWPAALLLLKEEGLEWFDFLQVLILLLALAFSYEADIALFLVLLLWQSYRVWRLYYFGQKHRVEVAVLTALAMGASWGFYRLFGPGVGDKNHFFDSFANLWEGARLLILYAGVLFPIAVLVLARSYRLKPLILFVLPIGYILMAGCSFRLEFYTSAFFLMRAFALPVAGVILMSLYAIEFNKDRVLTVFERPTEERSVLSMIVASILIIGAIFFGRGAHRNGLAINRLENMLAEKKSCFVVSQADYREKLGGDLSGWSLAQLSLIVQKSWPPAAIAFASDPLSMFSIYNNPCERIERGFLPIINQYEFAESKYPYLDFSRLRAKPKLGEKP